MPECSYCYADVVWVPTTEGFRPFTSWPSLPADAEAVVLKRHDCEERKQALKKSQKDYAIQVANDPVLKRLALEHPCPVCMAAPGSGCVDQRTSQAGRETKNPHFPRILLAVPHAD